MKEIVATDSAQQHITPNVPRARKRVKVLARLLKAGSHALGQPHVETKETLQCAG